MLIKRTALAVVIAFVMTGCATMREHPVACKATAALIGGTLGAVGGGVAVNEIEKDPVDDGEIAAGAAAGLVAGGLIGYLIGHYACPEEEVVVQERVTPPPPPAKGTKIAEIPGPNFDFDKATLTPAGKAKVADAARILKDNPTIHVEIGGHTDSIGSDAYNQRLSERRARAVADELIRDGISASRLTVRGYGERKPVADNKTEEGRARNRRVEIVVD
jgi:outer membrane protein OmpA-like peptidoglycan-associated protein